MLFSLTQPVFCFLFSCLIDFWGERGRERDKEIETSLPAAVVWGATGGRVSMTALRRVLGGIVAVQAPL